MKPIPSAAAIIAVLAGIAPTLPAAEPVADFSLIDDNPASPRHGQAVSPRDYQHQVSAYYFGDPG